MPLPARPLRAPAARREPAELLTRQRHPLLLAVIIQDLRALVIGVELQHLALQDEGRKGASGDRAAGAGAPGMAGAGSHNMCCCLPAEPRECELAQQGAVPGVQQPGTQAVRAACSAQRSVAHPVELAVLRPEHLHASAHHRAARHARPRRLLLRPHARSARLRPERGARPAGQAERVRVFPPLAGRRRGGGQDGCGSS